MRFLALFRAEWVKTMRMGATYIAFGAAGLLVILVQLGIFFGADDTDFYEFLQKNGFDTSLIVNGFVATRLAMEVGFGLLLAPMVILTFARQISQEDQRGTLRLILARPISRLGLLNAKFAVCAIYCLMLMGFVLSISYGMGVISYGQKDSITVGRFDELDPRRYSGSAVPGGSADGSQRPPQEMRRMSGEQRRAMRETRNFSITKFIIHPDECRKRLVIAWLLTSWALLTVGSIAFFFSSFNKHPIAAMALTIGTYFLVLILQQMAAAENIIPIFKWVRPYLFTTAMDFWRGCFSLEINWPNVRREALLLGSYTFAFFAAAQFIFWRRDITS